MNTTIHRVDVYGNILDQGASTALSVISETLYISCPCGETVQALLIEQTITCPSCGDEWDVKVELTPTD